MAEKRKHLARMNAKGLDDALDDDAVGAMIDNQGGRTLFLVEAVHGPFVTAIDGQQTINLIPGVVVAVPDEHSKPVRDLLRGLALGGPQALSYEDAGDAFVPPVEASAAAVQQVADDAAAAAADPEAPLPTGDGESTGGGEGDDGEPDADGPWPGDEGYVAPGTEPAEPEKTGDEVATARAKQARKTAGGKG